MSRSGYDEDDPRLIAMWRGRVASATRGARGQAFFRDLLAKLDAMSEKRLIADVLVDGTDRCALGVALGEKADDTETNGYEFDPEYIAVDLNIAECLAREVVFKNDEVGPPDETPEARWIRVRAWVERSIRD